MRPKISVLVPVYNVEKYLEQCLDSVITQSLQEIEIICINDGSTDNSLSILKRYAQSDSRIKIIDKANEGYGKAMNCGLDAAQGDYIAIVESDDWINPDMFTDLYGLSVKHNLDIVKSNWFIYTPSQDQADVKEDVLSPIGVGDVFAPSERTGIFFIQPSIWSALYRRDFLQKNAIRFYESPGASYQDIGFNFKTLILAERMYLTDKAYLHYRSDNLSSSVKSADKVFCVCDEWVDNTRFLEEAGLTHRDIYALASHIMLYNYIWNFKRLVDDKRRMFESRLIDDYLVIFEKKYIKTGFFTDKEKIFLAKFLKKKATKYEFMYLAYKLKRFFLKEKLIENVRCFYLFSVCPLYKSRKTINNYKISKS